MTSKIHNPRRMGALPGAEATSFRVWAPNADSVSVVGEFNYWDPQAQPMTREDGGMWAAEVTGAKPGLQYQFEITRGDLRFRKSDAYAREIHPKRAFRSSTRTPMNGTRLRLK